ncbi:XTP/dITP diphosphatase [Halobacillus sp. Marseille-Q1614]|uniref:XTP/dITP diphosphatase n=1 Tax=Halobacillus sp. Marseille-Q1614 TaxID=2709134 RepID=UPI00156FC734|nr:XTP/dITP diphosphatase [Halobacillus sp. Marseille-Q1614]
MKKVIIATKNEGKAREFKEMFLKYELEGYSLLDLNEPVEDIEETGMTFEENALIKAEAIARQFSLPVVADDSGLEVDALNGAPGIYSARYAGIEKDDQKNIDKLLSELKGVEKEKRTARFVCAIAIARPDSDSLVERGTCEGSIAEKQEGSQGFGYDPVFIPKGESRTMAEHTSEEKNAISHRKNAILKIEKWLSDL